MQFRSVVHLICLALAIGTNARKVPKKSAVLEEIKHSAKYNESALYNQSESGNFTHQPMFEYPEHDRPFFMQFGNATDPDEADRHALTHNSSLIFTVGNNSTEPICIFGRSSNLRDGGSVEFGVSGTNGIPIPANGTLQMGNTIPLGEGHHYNGIMYAKEGCDGNCGDCAGSAIVNTLLEFTYKEERLWSDISLGMSNDLFKVDHC